MLFQFADRLNHFDTGIFSALNEKKEARLAQGRPVYNMSVGTPDFPPMPHIQAAIVEASKDPSKFVYALQDLPELLDAVVSYYQRRFGVTLSTEDITYVNGSQEGIGHIGLTLCNPGDVVLLPNPGYPVFASGALLADAQIYYYPLLEENRYLPDFNAIPEDIARRAKYMILSYPLNPVCVTAPAQVYLDWIRFCQKYNIIAIHDNAYADIQFDGRIGTSFLAFPGAKEVGVEFFSLSKSFNTTGARMSFCIGNPVIIKALKKLRSQYDFNMFLPIQYGALAALNGPTDEVKVQCTLYQARRDALCGGLRNIGWPVPDSEGTMFAWAPIPKGYLSSQAFTMALLEQTGILVTPGDAFGPLGEGYVRFALVMPPEKIARLIRLIEESDILHP